MPFVDKPTDEMAKGISEAAEKILIALRGTEGTIAAMGALHVAMVIWAIGGATKEQAMAVCTKAVEVSIKEREN